MSYYDVLGVSDRTTDDEISRAYRELARRFHPDQHPGASPAEKLQLQQAMARINEAYAVLGVRSKRSDYDRQRTAEPEVDRRWPGRNECVLCGAAPAAPVSFEHQTGFLFAYRSHVMEAPMCRFCGLSYGRAKQNRTLWTGWWGLTAFFRNWLVVYRNARSLWRLRMTPPPRRRSSDVVAMFDVSLDPGSSVFRRGGVWFAALGLAVAIGGINDAAENERQANSGGFTPVESFDPGSSSATLRVGGCVRGLTFVEPVPCSELHDGRVVDTAITPDGCPVSAESYIRDALTVWCIDDR